MREAWQFAIARASRGRIAAIVIAVLLLSALAGALLPAYGASPAMASPIPAPRYQVIADIATMESRIDALERDNAELREDLKEARGQIGVLQLLRAYDIGFNQRTRAEDQKRIVALEWAVAGQEWPRCLK